MNPFLLFFCYYFLYKFPNHIIFIDCQCPTKRQPNTFLRTCTYLYMYLQKVFPFAYTEYVANLTSSFTVLWNTSQSTRSILFRTMICVCVCLGSHPELCEVNLSSIAQFCSWSCPHPHHRRGVRHADRMRCSLWGAICSFHHPSINQRVSRKDVEEVI